jgi:hypothetical protein
MLLCTSSILLDVNILVRFIFFFFPSDLSPQESTLLLDIVEVGQLPNFVPEDEKTRYGFYLLTRQGLKFECSSTSEIQVRLLVLSDVGSLDWNM